MHRLFIEWVKDKTVCVNAQNATLRQYIDIFNTLNLSFFKPKKISVISKSSLNKPVQRKSYNYNLKIKII